ncbi:hypothetical protein Q0M94_10805 [Deinococcus radiomollis]
MTDLQIMPASFSFRAANLAPSWLEERRFVRQQMDTKPGNEKRCLEQ